MALTITVNRNGTPDVTSKDTTSQLIPVEETAAVEYFEAVKQEYENERVNKQSLDSRAGLIVAFISTLCVLLFDKVQLSIIFQLILSPLTFTIFFKIICGVGVYATLIFTLVMCVKTIMVKENPTVEVASINEELVSEERAVALNRLIFTYRDIVIKYREVNRQRGKSFQCALWGIVAVLICATCYFALL